MQTKNQILAMGKVLRVIVLAAVCLAAAGAGSVPGARAEEAVGALTQAAHYIVFEKHADGSAAPVYYRAVRLAAPLRSMTGSEVAAALAVSRRNTEQMAVSLQSSDGRLVYQSVIQVSPWLRGEFEGEGAGAPIDGHMLEAETVSFVVRVPQVEGTTLFLADEGSNAVGQFDLAQLVRTTPAIALDPALEGVEVSSETSGPAGNRQDLLILGDGYTSTQKTKFSNDAADVQTAFFSISPYAEYKNYYNFHSLFRASTQAGADHPPYDAGCGVNDPTCCSDPEMQWDPLRGRMVNTVFDSRFCYYGIHRLLVPDISKVYAAASAVPDWDTILLIVNDTTYGGSGGSISTVSMHSSAPLIAQHEYGHTFVDLADEYEDAYPGFPACSDSSGSTPCEANVTNVATRAQIKWAPWIEASTPIPTPNNVAYDGLVGLFQGARYKSTGMYRPGYNCIMRSLGQPYCQVPSQAYVLKLYEGISLIEPGSALPASATLHLVPSAVQTFHADTLSPVGGPDAQISWLVNGTPAAGENTNTFIFSTNGSTPETNTITLKVKDKTTLVNADMAGSALLDKHTWTVVMDAKRLSPGSKAAQDGWVLESSETSGVGSSMNATATTLRVGDDAARKQYRAILSFNTGAGLPDNAVVTKVTLRVKKQGIAGGGDPVGIFQGFLVDVKKGILGTASLQAGDFQAAASRTCGPFSTAAGSTGWYSINLTCAKAYINKLGSSGGLTQVRLYFKLDDNNNTTANYLGLYSGNAVSAGDRPRLVIEYYVP